MISENAPDFRRETPRLICRLVRQWCAVSGEQQPDHVRTCADCAGYFRAARQLERRLRNEAVQLASSGVADTTELERQIVRAVRNSAAAEQIAGAAPASRRRVKERASSLGTWIGLAAGAAAAIATFVLWPASPSGPASAPASEQASVAQDAAVVVGAVESLSAELVDTAIPTAGKLVAENPLQHELGAVYSDVRSALDFLALNFLPAANVPAQNANERRI